MPPELQTRLLRVLSDGNYYRVGGHQPIKANVRIIAATHQNLEDRVKQGLFRGRPVPPPQCHPPAPAAAGERRETSRCCQYFLQKSAKELNVEAKTISETALNYLQARIFPQRRQLENLCHWLTVMTPTQQIEIADLPQEWREAPATVATGGDWRNALKQQVALALQRGDQHILDSLSQQFERTLISQALQHTGGRRIEAATLLGMGRNTLTRKIQELAWTTGIPDLLNGLIFGNLREFDHCGVATPHVTPDASHVGAYGRQMLATKLFLTRKMLCHSD